MIKITSNHDFTNTATCLSPAQGGFPYSMPFSEQPSDTLNYHIKTSCSNYILKDLKVYKTSKLISHYVGISRVQDQVTSLFRFQL